MGLMVTCLGLLAEAGRAVQLEAAQPVANRGHCGGEQPCGPLHAEPLGTFHQPQAMVIGVFHLTHQIEITSGVDHEAPILFAACRPALLPGGRPTPFASYRSNTSASPGGYDVTWLFQIVMVAPLNLTKI